MMSGGTTAPMQEAPAAGTVAPFVAKTYRMVDDPSTGAVIAWGPANNSFVVADTFAFARTLLPAYFKHCNFSSFVRQLNTYGFRKVGTDRWEFAHVSFLRGQTHLLHRVVRQRNKGGTRSKHDAAAAVEDEEGAAARLAMEVARLKREQKANEELLAAMCRRLQEIERRPKQMLAFLVKAAGDPQVLRRAIAGTAGSRNDGIGDTRETEDRGRFKSARLLPDSDCAHLGCGSGDGDEVAWRRSYGVQGGGEDDFDFTRFLTGGGSEGGPLMTPCTLSADGG